MARVRTESAFTREDRDLLVRLDTKMSSVESALADMKGNTTARLLNLEANAVNKIEFDDHEKRIRALETQRWIIAGSVGSLSSIGGYVLSIFF